MLPIVFVLFLSLVAALPTPDFGIRFEKRFGDLPILTLPYGQFQATIYDPIFDIYIFKNIRFAAPPTGNLRWAKPQDPSPNSTLSNGLYGPQCIQTSVPPVGPESEDCLFLDVYAPGPAVRSPTTVKLPVIHWSYGGSYEFGSKDLYSGTGLIAESYGNVIYVASNYRLGAYGFLAGTTMEKEGLPNAGFYDQHKAFEWINKYIYLVGGDPTEVSAWGESAGAGSIMHQLVSFGGTQDPLFKRAIMQSPAFAFQFDRKGSLERTFQRFAAAAGCAGKGVACLRAADPATLNAANTAVQSNTTQGSSPYGPSADGNLIRQVAALELKSGNYWKGVESFVLSHVENEAQTFAPLQVQTDDQFNSFVDATFPPYAKADGLNALIEAHYPPVMSGTNHKYPTETARVTALINEASFVCNVRYLADAYGSGSSVYNLNYNVPPALHATDLIPLFFIPTLPVPPGTGDASEAYQSYFTSHARTGSPNTFRTPFSVPPTINWPTVDNSGDAFNNVLNVDLLSFSLISDPQDTKTVCSFWEQVAAAVTNNGGYAPPGSVVNQTLVPQSGDPSANYAN